MFNLRPIGKMTKCFLSTSNINKIDLCIASRKMYFYLLLVFYFDKSNA